MFANRFGNRRQILGTGLGGLFAMAMRQHRGSMFAAEPNSNTKRCVVLWMEGGPSQMDTVDLKPGARTGGSFQPIRTASPEIQICEHLPNVASHMGKLSVIRNLTSKEGDHDRGTYCMHTGFAPVPSFPRPTAGSVISKHTAESDIPKFVTLGAPGIGPAFMGPDHAPFAIEDPGLAKQLMVDLGRRRNRLGLLEQLDRQFMGEHHDGMIERRRSMTQRIERIVTTRFVDALDLEQEPEPSRGRYGDTEFGRNCLLARRLIEAGVAFVEVRLDGWDTHSDNFRTVRELCQHLDRAWGTLMADLSASGLLDETIVLWMGEFGRTPIINATNGRDHFPDITPVVVGGGGLAGGRAIGKTNADGASIDGPTYKVADLFATLYSQFGIAPDAEFTTDFDSPTHATDDGRLISELFA